MTTSRSVRGVAALAAGAVLWGLSAGPAAADDVRNGQWPLQKYAAVDKVWPVSQGENVIVAVIDSGVADHQDLTGQVLPGTDLSAEHTSATADTVNHGTAMASVIAGHGHGGQDGIMGLAPKAKILPIRVTLSREVTFEGAGAGAHELGDAIRYAVDHGAKVINMSIGGYEARDTDARDAIKYAADKDVVLVAATGNSNKRVDYPAAYPGVVAVGAVDKTGKVWDRSNHGTQTTLAAPGVDVYHATSKSATSYGTGTGTSDASAYVSAIAALVRSKYPNLSAGQVINRMIKSAVAPPDKSAVPSEYYGYGIASAQGALAANPEVDNGPKENPLFSRPETDDNGNPTTQAGAPSASKSGAAAPGNNAAPKSDSADKGSNTMLFVGGGVALLVVIGLVVFFVARSRRGGGGSGGPGGPGGPGAPGGGGGYGYPQQQPYGAGAPGQAPQGYQQPQGGYPGQQYPPQQPQGPAAGSPYQR